LITGVSSNATDCRYCQAHAIRAAERYGAQQEQQDSLWEYRSHAAFSESKRATVDFCLAANPVPHAMDHEIKTRLNQY
jgi:alkylhydroperoxidase family enzyme